MKKAESKAQKAQRTHLRNYTEVIKAAAKKEYVEATAQQVAARKTRKKIEELDEKRELDGVFDL